MCLCLVQSGSWEILHLQIMFQISTAYHFPLYTYMLWTCLIIGPILDDRLRKNSWNPERVSSVFTFLSVCVSVCLCVCTRATEHTFWPRSLIFGSSDPRDMRKKIFFVVFRNFRFYAFYWHFSIFSLYNTSQ